VDVFATYTLQDPALVEVPLQGDSGQPVRAVAGLRIQDGYQCLFCLAGLTRDLKAMQRHVSKIHHHKPALHRKEPLWRPCKLQTFFAETQFVRYFIVFEDDAEVARPASSDNADQLFFQQVDDDIFRAEEDVQKNGNIVHGFDRHPSAVVPWLRRTGIADHVRGLEKDEIRASFIEPRDSDSEPELFLMLDVLHEIL